MTDTWNGVPYDDDDGGWDMMSTMPRKRDLSGNIIDGAYADGKTKVTSRGSHPYDDWKAAYDGLKRIRNHIWCDEHSGVRTDEAQIAASVLGMVRTLVKRLGL